jgi:hypothetical protein
MDVEKNGGRLFRRPKLTLSCSAEGKEGKGLGRDTHTDTQTDGRDL